MVLKSGFGLSVHGIGSEDEDSVFGVDLAPPFGSESHSSLLLVHSSR